MHHFIWILFRLHRSISKYISFKIGTIYVKNILKAVGVSPYKLVSNGFPVLDFGRGSTIEIGHSFKMNNGECFNKIGRQQPCYLIVAKGAKLVIGNNVGMSSTAIICQHSIHIADNVRIGGNVTIYDTDFHSLNYIERTSIPEVKDSIERAAVRIEKNAFIGAHVTVLKGVTIGTNSIIGAGSLVSKSVPDNQIWAGNPAKFIRML